MKSLMSKGQALQEKQHSGQPLEPAEISAFERDRDALLKNPVASGFLDAQEEMHDLQHSVQKFVAKTIELGRIPAAEDLAEGSCGHGCGCSRPLKILCPSSALREFPAARFYFMPLAIFPASEKIGA